MKVRFDPAKNAVNIAKHGLSFDEFEGFDVWTTTHLDVRVDYGETRFRAFGRIAGLGYSIAYTETDEGIRLISFRRAHEKEMRRYE